jgi:CDP-diacylglycerol--glycerol-3-phosphate 3-phosphatidyltransferase
VTGLRSLAFSRGLIVPASSLGKLKMVTQVVTVLLLLLGWERFPILLQLGKLMLWAVMATALGSALDYFWRVGWAMNAMYPVTVSPPRAARPRTTDVA